MSSKVLLNSTTCLFWGANSISLYFALGQLDSLLAFLGRTFRTFAGRRRGRVLVSFRGSTADRPFGVYEHALVVAGGVLLLL